MAASGRRTLDLALGLLALAFGALATIEVILEIHGGGRPTWALLLFVVVALDYAAGGLIAWSRRPTNRTGALLCLGAVSWFAAALQNTNITGLVVIGLVFGVAPIGVVLHVLVAFPSGRLTGRPTVLLVAGGYVATIILQAPQYLFSDNSGPIAAMQISPNHSLVVAGVWLARSVGIVVIAGTVGLLVTRLRHATRAQRRVLLALDVCGVVVIVFSETAVSVFAPLFSLGPITVFVLQASALGLIPMAFLIGTLRGGFARMGEVAELGAWLGADAGGRRPLGAAVADALGDPSVEILFWLPSANVHVDGGGIPVDLPGAASGRGVVDIDQGGDRIGAIVYDAVLIADPGPVRAAARVVAVALERDRLTAELFAAQDALRASRARIIEAADRERRRIARDLHDGLQGQLVLLAFEAGRVANAVDGDELRLKTEALRAGLELVGAEVRRLVQGVMPALLIERGLFAATEDLVDRLPVPTRLELSAGEGALTDGVRSTGYFVVAEAITNAIKHARASALAVRLSRTGDCLEIEVRDDGVGGASLGAGSGLRGIADRVDGLGGKLRVDSPVGGGTRVLAEVPCGS